ncbi:MAG: hypothetical protein GY679_01525 [Mycoplasma sp.]|nr:hypothetical protein [Mycoplasma sp.]
MIEKIVEELNDYVRKNEQITKCEDLNIFLNSIHRKDLSAKKTNLKDGYYRDSPIDEGFWEYLFEVTDKNRKYYFIEARWKENWRSGKTKELKFIEKEGALTLISRLSGSFSREYDKKTEEDFLNYLVYLSQPKFHYRLLDLDLSPPRSNRPDLLFRITLGYQLDFGNKNIFYDLEDEDTKRFVDCVCDFRRLNCDISLTKNFFTSRQREDYRRALSSLVEINDMFNKIIDKKNLPKEKNYLFMGFFIESPVCFGIESKGEIEIGEFLEKYNL